MMNRCLLLLAGILIASCPPSALAARSKDKSRKKEPVAAVASTSRANSAINLCTNDEPDAQLHCFCDGGGAVANVTAAECWVFNDRLTRDYPGWGYFVHQPRVRSLRILVKPHGNLTFVPTAALAHLRQLQKFDISYAAIGKIHAYAFANLSQLAQLKLVRNQISALAPHSFANLLNLSELNLAENAIHEIYRDVFVALPALRRLLLSQNRLSVLQEGAFRNLTALHELELASNFINVLTKDTFQGLEYLRKLDLGYNKINMLGDLTFSELWLLEELILESNQIEMITDRAFAGLTNLRLLNLNNNKLTLLSPMLFGGVPGIHHLDLRANRLETLTLDNVRPIVHNMYNASSTFHIENNRFICDCRLAWMYGLRNETKNAAIRRGFDELLCYWEPDHLNDIHADAIGAFPQSSSQQQQQHSIVVRAASGLAAPSATHYHHQGQQAEVDEVEEDEDDDGGGGAGTSYIAESNIEDEFEDEAESSYEEDEEDYNDAPSAAAGGGGVSGRSRGAETTRDPTERYLLQIPVGELPCPQKEVPTEDTLRKNLNGPLYADINGASSAGGGRGSGGGPISACLSTSLVAIAAFMT